MSVEGQRFSASQPVTVDIAPRPSEKIAIAKTPTSEAKKEQTVKIDKNSSEKSTVSTNNVVAGANEKDQHTAEGESSPGNENQQIQEPAKKKVITLSVANLMSDPTPLNVVHNKAPAVMIKSQTSNIPPPTVAKITVRTVQPSPLSQPFITTKPTPEYQSLQAPPIPVIQTHANRQNQFNVLNQNFQSQTQYQFAQQYYGQQQAVYGQKYGQPQYQQSYPMAQYSSQIQNSYQQTQQRAPFPQPVVIMPMQQQSQHIPIPTQQYTKVSNQINSSPKNQQQTAIKHQHDMQPSEPIYYPDEDSGQYGIRCTCGDNHNNGQIVQCEKCQFWLHMVCVNIPRASSADHFYCPFCLERRLRCRCKKNKNYNFPIIQCSKCGMWVHKTCEGLGFGIAPKPFLCSSCHRLPFVLPTVSLSQQEKDLRDFNIFVEPNRFEIVNSIQDGPFKSMLEHDLSNSELNFFETIAKYYNKFCQHFFSNQASEFWKVFVSTFSQLFGCDPIVICTAIDRLTYRLLYAATYTPFPDKVEKFEYSESISNYVNNSSVQEYKTMPQQTQLALDMNGNVITPVQFNDGDYICDLPGFLMHTDEMPSDNGIPPICFAVEDTDLVIDMSGSPFTFAPNVRRSFHPNASVRLIRVGGKPRVALYAEKQYGPLIDDKVKHQTPCLAIPAGGEIILPFDGDLPFQIEKIQWKDKKQRVRIATRAKEEKPQKKKRVTVNRKSNVASSGPQIELTLLSGFLLDDVPPLPFVIISDEQMDERKRVQEKAKERRSGKSLANDDFVFE